LWIPAKDHYSKAVVFVSSKLAAGLKSAKFEELAAEHDLLQVTFSPLAMKSMLVDITVKTSSYTFNAPLTFAIMSALYFYLTKRARAYAEALLMLFLVHFLYVFSLEAKELTEVFASRGIGTIGSPSMIFYQFLWSFTDNMIIRFEPFLIGFYMYMRFGINAK
jgi:hypothetical protein